MKELILADVTTKKGHLNESYIHDLTLLDLVTLEIYTCVVDEHYNNFTRCRWDQILSEPIQYGLYGNLIRTAKKNNEGLPVISADSYPQLMESLTAAEVMTIIERRKEQLGLD